MKNVLIRFGNDAEILEQDRQKLIDTYPSLMTTTTHEANCPAVPFTQKGAVSAFVSVARFVTELHGKEVSDELHFDNVRYFIVVFSEEAPEEWLQSKHMEGMLGVCAGASLKWKGDLVTVELHETGGTAYRLSNGWLFSRSDEQA